MTTSPGCRSYSRADVDQKVRERETGARMGPTDETKDLMDANDGGPARDSGVDLYVWSASPAGVEHCRNPF